jgi:DNA-binding MarR family transcriptional regulator
MNQLPEPQATDYLLAQICRLHHGRARELLHEIGLYRGQPRVLDILHEEEGLTHTELATRLQVAPATVSKTLQRMEKAGFLVRQPDPEDERVSRVYLTGAGREIREEMRARLGRLAQDTLRGFDSMDHALLRRLLLRVHENLLLATGQTMPERLV